MALAAFALADGVLPNLAWVGLGVLTGRIPAAVTGGLGSAAGRALLVSLAIGTGAYALSLMRTPAENLLESYSSAVMADRACSAAWPGRCARPRASSTWRIPAVLDQLSSASGELTSTRPSDAAMTLAGAIGDRLGGLGACVVLATFRWWLGLLFLAGWLVIRPPLRRLLTERALLTRRGHPGAAAQLVLPGLRVAPAVRQGDAGVRPGRLDPRPPPGTLDRGHGPVLGGEAAGCNRRALALTGLVAAMYAAGAGALGLAAYRQEIGLGTLAIMLPDDGDDHAGRWGVSSRRGAGADAGRRAGPGRASSAG